MVLCMFLFSFWFSLMVFYNVNYMFLLLILEVLLLSVFLLFSFGVFGGFSLYGLFFFLVVVVCMGGFSVSLLVGVSRYYGRDFWFFRYIF